MKSKKFTYYTWGVVAYLLFVILWGAFVRATGAGAGCGRHWPTCNGQIIPRPEEIETLIEFGHRLTSAFLGVLIIIMLIWAFRLYPKKHLVRRGAVLSLIFVIIEGAIGAGLVLLEYVALDQSIGRTISIALHLVNTLILLAVVLLTAYWSQTNQPAFHWREQGKLKWLFVVAYALMFILGASGAITALGDTLFPASSLAEGIQQDFSPTAHFLIRLRLWHPIIAIGSGIYLIWLGTAVAYLRPSRQTTQLSRGLKVMFILQLAGGFLNVYLLAPVWMQLVHLFMADTVWILLVLMTASVLNHPATEKTHSAPTMQAVN